MLGYVLRYLMNRRSFNRRNAAGIGEFSSFEAATGTRFLEGAGRKLGSFSSLWGYF